MMIKEKLWPIIVFCPLFKEIGKVNLIMNTFPTFDVHIMILHRMIPKIQNENGLKEDFEIPG